jgi:hypothetical protein
MKPTLRSFIGAIMLLIYIVIYALLVMAFSASRINGSSYEGIFYVIAGFAWLPGAMWIISFMAKGRKS